MTSITARSSLTTSRVSHTAVGLGLGCLFGFFLFLELIRDCYIKNSLTNLRSERLTTKFCKGNLSNFALDPYQIFTRSASSACERQLCLAHIPNTVTVGLLIMWLLPTLCVAKKPETPSQAHIID